MTWLLLLGIIVSLATALAIVQSRRLEIARMEQRVRARERAVSLGSDKAQLQHPVIDLSRCLGCGTCVAACPEDNVLELVHGQAMVVNGARCVGVSACERECPVGAITVTLADVEERSDIPAITEELEAVGTPGLFLAGEVTAHALIKTAVDHGTAVASEVARRCGAEAATPADVLELCIVGAGPAGLACALEAKRLGLRSLTLEQEAGPGGTVGKYPRRKLVISQPIELPLVGRLPSNAFTKEELIELWTRIATQEQLAIQGGQVFTGVERESDGNFIVRTETHAFRARNVCLALGRRGTPRQLGVPGEELPKVAYALLDAHSYTQRRVLVVGGGDAAVEAALGLAEQPGNEVTLSYRGKGFFRIRPASEARLERMSGAGRIQVLLQSEVSRIGPSSVTLAVRSTAAPSLPAGGPLAQPPVTGLEARVELPNDDVFILAGGVPPFELLQRSGVSFDPNLRAKPELLSDQGTGLTRALIAGLGLALIALLWSLWHADYYLLAPIDRPVHAKHDMLRPGRGVGLWLGIIAVSLVVANLLYLVRRSPRFRLQRGSLRGWMTSHVATGILALLCALLHAAMAPRDTVGGHALEALAVLLVTGAIGRYFYAWIPRAANGRELEIAEIKGRLARMSDEWDQGQRRFRERARDQVFALIERRQWRSSFVGRVLAIAGLQRDLRTLLRALAEEGEREGVADHHIRETLQLARVAHRTALVAAHYEDLRAVLNSWRYVHRWVAALMVLLVVLHVVYALKYAAFTGGFE